MSNLCVITLIVACIALSKATIFSQKYTAKLELNDKISNYEILGEQDSHSLTECATMCRGECIVFGFNSQTKKCRTHKKVCSSEMTKEDGWRYYSHQSHSLPGSLPLDCKELYEDGRTTSGVYDIYPHGTITRPVSVYCDMVTMCGGWTAIQKRVIGSLSFDRDWSAYKNGFGSPEQDVWVGNDFIHLLTKENNSALYVSITLQNGTTLYEMYDRFSVSNEAGKYQLFLAGPATGTLGDSMLDTGSSTADLSGMSFSTPDRDNDRWSGSCAVRWGGGWWFNNCHDAFLNGPWSPGDWYEPWTPTVTSGASVKATSMMIRRH
ncbi:microfibril-associated glycoprotein 4-like [Saccostrea cucullata]|uniref:microfibril-associated glycoprotein 4-like n=1 Tax=Saccostrea cuccullata TaxID=36930 RepID=UPI002ED0B1D0